MLKLKQLNIKNFKSFGNKTQSVNLNTLGLTLLVGENQDSFQSNGAGKSSFLDAIVYALYGSTSDGSRGNTIVNRKTGKNMRVSLEFSVNKDNYKIIRYRKDSKHKNKSYLYLNGKNITPRSIKKTNELLNNIIGIDKDTYLHSYMFNGEGAKFASLTDRGKKKILDDMINVSVYPIAHDISKRDADNVKSKLKNIKVKIDATKYNLKSLSELQKSTYKAMKQHKHHLYSLKNRLITLKQKCLSLGQTQSTHSLQYYETKIKSCKQQINNIQPQLDNSKEQQDKVDADQANARKAGQNFNQSKWMHSQAKNKLTELNKKLISLVNGKQKRCYWCGQVLNKAERTAEINKLAQAIKTQTDKCNHLNKLIDEANHEYQGALKVYLTDKGNLPNIASLTNKLSLLNNSINDYSSHAMKIQGQLNDLNVVAKEYADVAKQKVYQNYDKKIEHDAQLLSEQASNMSKLKKQYTLYKQSEQVYSNHGVKSMLLDLVLPFINKQANHYLQILTNGSISMEIVPTTTSKSTGNTSEKINTKITNNHGADNYDGLSSGEKKRVDLSILLALQDYVLSKASTNMNLISFDEVFDALDESGQRDVVRLLASRAKEFPNILVVSHNAKLKQSFTNYLIIEKNNGVSVIK